MTRQLDTTSKQWPLGFIMPMPWGRALKKFREISRFTSIYKKPENLFRVTFEVISPSAKLMSEKNSKNFGQIR